MYKRQELLIETSALLSDMKVALAALEDITEESLAIPDACLCAHAYHCLLYTSALSIIRDLLKKIKLVFLITEKAFSL